MSDVPGVFSQAFSKNRSDIVVAIGVIASIMMLILPMPTILLDLFQGLNLVIALLIILIVLYARTALDFSIFPTILLISTVFSLALNVSSTRLILSQGADFDGRLVRSFGEFVVGSKGTEGLVIGVIIYIIIVAVQFMVITKGATRVAEVAARFTLDALPGKQMAIDAEFSSGSLTEEEAQRKKNILQKEVDFYGAMDGASKFVSGNVTVGILITLVNIIGGMIVGMSIHGESLELALSTYISLTIGDGLVSQLPALLVSVATGLIVTRAISDGTLGDDVSKQFTRQSRIYWVAGAFVIVLAFIPGFPWYVLLPMGAGLLYLGYTLTRKETKAEEERLGAEQASSGQASEHKPKDPGDFSSVAPLDPIAIELGYGLVSLVDAKQGAELLERITKIRRETALDTGLMVPKVRIIDNLRLEATDYCIKIKGVEVGKGTLRLGSYLCIQTGNQRDDLQGEKVKDPVFGLPSLWIGESQRDKAERGGYTVVDAPSIIATHLTEIIKRNAADILGRQEVKSMLDGLRKDYSAVVEDVNEQLGVGEIQKVLQGLLRERISIRNMVIILETLSDFGKMTKDVYFLIEKVRQALSRQISYQYADEDKKLHVITLDPGLEQQILESRLDTAAGPVAALASDIHRQWISALQNAVRSVQDQGTFPIILSSEGTRSLIKQSTLRDLPELVVLSVMELAADIQVEGIAEIRIEG